MFQFPPFPPYAYGFSVRYPGIPPGGFPHSEIPGSTLVGSSPRLIAAYHVLHRPLAPRHPPCALSSLIITPQDLPSYSVFKVPSQPPPSHTLWR